MEADPRGRSGRFVNDSAWKALAVIACWLFTASPAAWPQPPGDRVLLLKGAERADVEPDGRTLETGKILLLNGAERAEYVPQSEAALARRLPVIKMLPPRNLDPMIIEATRRDDGWQPSFSQPKNPVSRAATALKTAILPLQAPGIPPPTSKGTSLPLALQPTKTEEQKPEPAPATKRRIVLEDSSSAAESPRRAEVSRPDEGQVLLSGNFLYKIALVQLTSDLAMLVVAVLVFAGAFLLIQRRFSLSLDALRRLESASSQGAAPAELQPRTGFTNEALAGPASGEAFDLGLSYAEEMRLRDEASHQQEQAILRQIYEQNVKLREQIGALEPAA
jgi:hypothetical protein